MVKRVMFVVLLLVLVTLGSTAAGHARIVASRIRITSATAGGSSNISGTLTSAEPVCEVARLVKIHVNGRDEPVAEFFTNGTGTWTTSATLHRGDLVRAHVTKVPRNDSEGHRIVCDARSSAVYTTTAAERATA